MAAFKKRAFRLWILLLILLLLAGVAVTVAGLIDFDRSFHLPRGAQSAFDRCIRGWIVV